ncbi:hypothetical protein CTAYLR_009308 [Chrysophaeum taylorii]|uniref:proteasome endopeptidase complex n=1 Tax=Chrysophaeum taylorii TaxID=2483200 RepID=A0AAD7UJL1_9STRA|nr:hypothetical protein CTAYLR_009308 [Chrysophaeum taylorii]
MGADSRVSTGTYVANRVSDKVTAIHDKIYLCRSGSAADTQAVSDYVRHYLGAHAIECGRPPLVKTAANLCKRICYANKDRLLASVIVAGWTPTKGVPFAIGGSGSTYIYGHVDHVYRPDMTKAECVDFVKTAVERHGSHGSSGGIIRLVDISAEVSSDFVVVN